MNLRIVILETKALANGTHRLRIAVSHNREMRYIPTRFSVPSIKNLRDGSVVNVPNAPYINQQLRNQMNRIYMVFDELEEAKFYTCSQLIKVIQGKLEKGGIRTFEEIAAEMIRVRKSNWAPDTIRLHELAIRQFIEYAGPNYVLSLLDSAYVYGFRDFLKGKGYSETTVTMRIATIRRIAYFAQNHGYAKFDLPPFFDYKEPIPIARDIALSIEQFRELRDLEISDKWSACARDIFMLSFYLCGMNLADIVQQDLTLPYVKFIRTKTKSRRNPNEQTEFSIQPEARGIIDHYLVDGKLMFYGRSTKKSIQHITDDHLRRLRAIVGFDKLIFYSARKTFAQIANELMIKDTIIEYCLGDAPSNPRRALNFYVRVNKRIADTAIRKVFDAVASNKTIEQLLAELGA